MTTTDKVKAYSKLYEVYNKDIEKVVNAIHISKKTLQKYLKIKDKIMEKNNTQNFPKYLQDGN